MDNGTRTVRLWFLRETHAARLYSKVPSTRNPDLGPRIQDTVWVPRSVVERCQKQPAKVGEAWPEHFLGLPEWFANENGL